MAASEVKNMKAYQLKISLQRVKPPVWRRFVVPAGINFGQLAVAVTETMGWAGGRHYGFRFEKEKLFLHHSFGIDRVVDALVSLGIGYKQADARGIEIDDMLREGLTFRFDYDFGYDWSHAIKVEKVLDDCPNDCPRVIKYAGNCPPEDVGGPVGYREFLRIIGDPADPEHEEKLQWGRSHCVEYDPDKVNEALMDLAAHEYRDPHAHRSTPAGPNSFITISKRIPTMRADELKSVFEHPETLFGYLIAERAPVFDLYSLFENFKLKELRDLAARMNLPGRSSLRKSELADAIYDRYMDSTLLHAVLNQMNRDEMHLLHDIMNAEIYYITDENFPYEFGLTLLINHVITAFYDEEDIAIVAIKEFREKYVELLAEMQETLDDVLDVLDDFALAAANLYGAIAMKDFLSVYTEQAENDLDEETVRRFLSDMIGDEDATDAEYRIRGDLLISDMLEDWSDEEIVDFYEKSQAYPLRVPPKDQFLSYADPLHFEKTPAHTAFIEFIRNKTTPDAKNEAQPELPTGEICSALRQWAPMRECFDILESFGIEIDDSKERKRAEKLISQMLDNTRIWGYNGATPHETLSQKSGKLPHKNPERKIGRNEPCPCGSGKKYKNCCGKTPH
jgi:hypothetical protein